MEILPLSLLTSISVASEIFSRSYSFSVKSNPDFFTAVHLVPPASTWSRIRHSSSTGQPPLRTRGSPAGLSHLSPQLQLKVEESNRQVETVTWLFEQAVLCTLRKVWVLLVFPEDLGGHVQSGPTTIWSNSHLRRLDGVSDVRRGAAYLCQFAGTESRRPVGLFTNLAGVKAQMVHGWPRLYKVDNHYLYDGPLNDHCSCKQPHTPMKGVNSNEEFHSSASSGFGKQFWLHSLQSFLPFEEHVPLGAGGTSSTSSSLSPSHLSSAPLFSLSRHSGSDSSLYDAWSSGTLSRGMLSDFMILEVLHLETCQNSADLRGVPLVLAPQIRLSVTLVLGLLQNHRLQLHSLHSLWKRPW